MDNPPPNQNLASPPGAPAPTAPGPVLGPGWNGHPPPDQATHAAIPALAVAHPPQAVLAILLRQSQAGRLPGFLPTDGGSGSAPSFKADIHGTIYDRDLIARLDPGAHGCTIRFSSRLRRRVPVIVVVVTILSIWPGVLVTDSLLTTWFSWYPKQMWVTVAWYVPLCLLTVPVLWKQYKASERASEAHLRETLGRISGWLGPK